MNAVCNGESWMSNDPFIPCLNELCKLEEEIQQYISTSKTEQNQVSRTYPGFGSLESVLKKIITTLRQRGLMQDRM